MQTQFVGDYCLDSLDKIILNDQLNKITKWTVLNQSCDLARTKLICSQYDFGAIILSANFCISSSTFEFDIHEFNIQESDI